MDKLNKMEEKLGSMTPEQLSQNAQHVWQMLDDMAENNPQMYRKFIDKQMQAAKEHSVKPKPHMCVQTKITAPFDSGLFINIFDWTRVPAPKSDDDPIPVVGGTMYDGKDDSGVYKIVTVAFNPKVTDDFGIDSSYQEERKMLINLAIDFLQDQHKCSISRYYTLLRKPRRYKGTLVKAIETVSKRTREQDQAMETEVNDLERMFGSLTPSNKDSLLGKLSNITVEEKSEDCPYVRDDPINEEAEEANSSPQQTALNENTQQSPSTNSGLSLNITGPALNCKAAEPDIKLPFSADPGSQRSGLIQEIGVKEGAKGLIEPDFEICMKRVSEASELLEVRIKLPGVTSVSECELDISKKDLHLVVEDQYELVLPFKQQVNEETAKAKFSKKASTLTLSLPVL